MSKRAQDTGDRGSKAKEQSNESKQSNVSREIERLKSKEHEGESKVDRDKQSKDRSEDVSEDVGEVARLTKEVHNEVHKQTEGVSEQGGVKQSDAALLLNPAMAMNLLLSGQATRALSLLDEALLLARQ
ncbi:hypothetical protein B484DRAFT_409330, partial [Ochromonadaceae sp. CCMP2298]